MNNLKFITYSQVVFFFSMIGLLLFGCSDDDAMNLAVDSFAQESEGVLVIEAENTTFSQTMWELRNASNPGRTGVFGETDITFDGVLEDFRGVGYLEYSGQDSFSEPSDTSMVYSFRIENPGTYYLFFRAFENHTHDPDTENSNLFAGDRNNDAFIRMEGNFQANTSFERNGRFGATLNELSEFNKFFCSSNDSDPDWGRSIALEPDEFREPVYIFNSGEIYNLFVIGRSSQLAIDRIYLARLEDENGNTDGDNIFSFNSIRRAVEDGDFEVSEFITN
ncbi:MAG: hypothetical protein AAF363_09435 [Bacteroidota bacterium]